MKKAAKITSLSLCIVLLLQIIGCGSGEKTSTDNGKTTVETSASEETVVPEKNWDGREFRVLGYDGTGYPQFTNFEVYSEGEIGEVVNDEVYRRNSVIEDKYNVRISQYLTAVNTMETVRQTAASQEDLYDLGFFFISGLGTLAREKLLYDLNNVDYIDFDKDYWNKWVNDTLSFKNKLFFTSSDFSLRDKNRAYIMVYNRAMAEDFGIDNVTELVRGGTWVIDKMAEYSKKVSGDLNGNGAIDEEDRFGIAMDSYNAFATFIVAGKNIILTKTSDDKFELTMNNERTISTVEKAFAMTSKREEAIYCEDWEHKVNYDVWYVAHNMFSSGRVLFFTTFPHDLKQLTADCEFNYRIIPFPKLDEVQDHYYTLADFLSMLFGIPITNPDPDFAGYMLEVLSAASTDTSLQAYYEISCKTKYAYDEVSAEMLDLIFSNIVYEPALVYAIGGLHDIYFIMAQNRNGNFASVYKTREKQAIKDLELLDIELSEAQ